MTDSAKISKQPMTRVIVLGAYPESLTNFRGEFVRALVDRGNHVTAMSAEADETQVSKILALGADHCPYFVRRNGLNPWADVRTFIDLYRCFRRIRPEIVFAYTIKPVVWGGYAARLCRNVQFVALITGLGFAFQGRSLRRRLLSKVVTHLYRGALRGASSVVFQNLDNRNEFVKRKIVPIEKTYVVNGSGVDVEHFQYAAPRMDGEAPTFLMIARLLGEKGIREYVDAAKSIRLEHPDARFLLVGPTDPSPDGISIDEVEQWNRDGHVEYLGELADVRSALVQSHVYVLPSYHEGMPRTVLEAMAVGRPILTTDVPGCRETVIADRNGLLVPAKNAEALADRMRWFIDNPERIEEMGSESRDIAETWFDVHGVNRRLMAIMFQQEDEVPRDQLSESETPRSRIPVSQD